MFGTARYLGDELVWGRVKELYVKAVVLHDKRKTFTSKYKATDYHIHEY